MHCSVSFVLALVNHDSRRRIDISAINKLRIHLETSVPLINVYRDLLRDLFLSTISQHSVWLSEFVKM